MMNNENGRSMVEMLGVLAIIGVLSVAGIAGYTMAMKKYRSNEILNAASQMAILARAANGGTGISNTNYDNNETNTNYGIPNPVSGVTLKVKKTGDTYAIQVSGAGTGDSDPCGIASDNVNSALFTIDCVS